MEVSVDRNECVGCLLCVKGCRAVFGLNDCAAMVKDALVLAVDRDACREAAADCPVGAIAFEMQSEARQPGVSE